MTLTVGARIRLLENVVCRAAFLPRPLLLVPGMPVHVVPTSAVLLGQWLTPRDTLRAYADKDLLGRASFEEPDCVGEPVYTRDDSTGR